MSKTQHNEWNTTYAVHKKLPVSSTKLMPGLTVGFFGSYLAADKLFPVNLRMMRTSLDKGEPPA